MITSLSRLLFAVFLFSISISGPLLAQAQEPCATESIRKEQLDADPEYRSRAQAAERKLQDAIKTLSKNRAPGDNDTIPVVVHVLHTGQAVGTGFNISDAQIQSSIDRTNEVFADYDGNGTDSNIRFALAVRDPSSCVSSTGINRIDASGVENYETVGMTTGTERINLFNLSRWNTEEYLNFWVVSEINDNNGGSGTQGFATQSATSHTYDGVVCMYNTTGYDPNGSIGYNVKSDYNQNETVIHEFAHYLDLYHTFHGDDTACPTDDECGVSGDCCADTDVHRRTYSNVCWTGSNNSCTGNNYGDVVKNYMAYSSQDCKDQFTDDQAARMQAILLTGRAGLLTSPGLKAIIATEPTVACAANTSSTGTGSNFGVGFTKITIGDWTTESANTYEEGGYQDNWCNQIDLAPNTAYSFDITTSGNYTEYVRAWIDYDNNGTFSNTELIISPGSKASNFTGTFTTPSTLIYNSSLRIRFRSSQSSSTSACHSPTYSQAEDYSVYFENNALLTASETALTNLRGLSCCESTAQSFTIDGADLLSNVAISIANTDFEISSNGTSYSNSLTLNESGGSVENGPVTIYTRLKSGLTTGVYSDNITISSSPATDVVIPIDGEVDETDGVRGNVMSIATRSAANHAIANNYKGVTGANSRTYEAWLKTTDSDAGIAANGVTNSDGEAWFLALFKGKLSIAIQGGWLVGTNEVSDGEWHHVAVVLDSGTGANLGNTVLYLDGKEEAIPNSGGLTTAINTIATQNLLIGNDDHNNFFEGEIDEVRVWSVARTQSQIRESMHLTLAGNETGLEAYYQFNETTGTTINDPVNGHDLTLVGSVNLEASTLDVASGSCSTVTVGSTGNSAVEVNSNNIEIDFEDGGTAPDGDLVVYYIEDLPVNGCGENYEGTHHWVVRNFGNNQSGLDLESVKLTLPTTDAILDYDAPSMSLHKRLSSSDGAWAEVGDKATSVNSATGEIHFETLTGFTTFSQISVGSSGAPLPVELIAFSAMRKDNTTVDLRWTTATEENNSGFEIEKSYDGLRFDYVDFVEGKGTASNFNSYGSEVLESKDTYYRLKQIDYDGTSTLSAIQFVRGYNNISKFILFPNPTDNSFKISSPENFNEELVLSISNVHGTVFMNTEGDVASINSKLDKEVSEYPSGVYFVTIKNGHELITERLIINK